MKRSLLILSFIASLLTFSPLTQAKIIQQAHITTPGFYLGVQGGVSFAGYKSHLASGYVANAVHTFGVATRVYAGFDFNRYFGTEFSVSFSHMPHFINVNGGDSHKIKNNVIYIAAKGQYPFTNRLAANAILGLAYVVRSGVIIQAVPVLPDKEIATLVYGLGLSYLVGVRWAVDLTWFQAAKKSTWRLPCSNFVGIGIHYKFAA